MVQNVKDTISVIVQIQNQAKFMNTSTEHIPQCNQSEQLADASGRIVDLMNENGDGVLTVPVIAHKYRQRLFTMVYLRISPYKCVYM